MAAHGTLTRGFLAKAAALAAILFAILLTTPSAAEEQQELLFQADEIVFDSKAREATARGNVEVHHEGYYLRADTVSYNQETGVVHAIGRVKIVDPDGHTVYVDEARLDDELREGFIVNLRLVFSDGSRLAARDGERTEGNKTVLNYAVFTPCEICDNHPDRPPSWAVRAVRVTHDQGKQRIYYHDATLDLFGLPVAWLPWLSHPDPSVTHATGFLTPEVNARRELGLVLKVSYYISFSPSSDATITPILTTQEGLVLAAEHRRHLGFGQFQVEGSITRTDERDVNNVKTGEKEMRGHIFAEGAIDHGEHIDTFVKFQLASDDTYLRRYGFSTVDTLESEYRTQGFYGRSYFAAQSLWFQGLRIEDVQGLTGFALPLVNLDYVSEPGWAGSVWRVRFNGLALHRTDGMDTRRLSLAASWELPYTTRFGQQLKLGLHARGDVYNIANADRPDDPLFAGQNGTEGRFLPHLTASFRWPLLKVGGGIQQIIEPVVTLVLAPDGGNPPELSNEDSRTFELTDTNILSDHRLPGLDRWEGGGRVNYGIQYTLHTERVDMEAFVAQSYRFTAAGDDPDDIFFPQGSGLSNNFSDYVTRLAFTVDDWVRISHRTRLDHDSFTIRRNEIDATVYFPRGGLVGIGYYKLNRNLPAGLPEDREEIRIHGSVDITDNWQFFGNLTRNLTGVGNNIFHGVGVIYADCCVEITLSWRRTFTSDRDIVPGHSVYFRIRLKHLG